MAKRWQLFIVVAMAVSGCSEQPTSLASKTEAETTNQLLPSSSPASKPVMNDHSRKLAAMPEGDRLKMIGSAIKSSGEQCDAKRTMFSGSTADGQDFWSVDCGDTDKMLRIKPDSSTATLECSVMASFNTPCWVVWPTN